LTPEKDRDRSEKTQERSLNEEEKHIFQARERRWIQNSVDQLFGSQRLVLDLMVFHYCRLCDLVMAGGKWFSAGLETAIGAQESGTVKSDASP
jgi:hypothetical protein